MFCCNCLLIDSFPIDSNWHACILNCLCIGHRIYRQTQEKCTVLTHVCHTRLNFPGKLLKGHILKNATIFCFLFSYFLILKQSYKAWTKQRTHKKNIRWVNFFHINFGLVSIFWRKFGFTYYLEFGRNFSVRLERITPYIISFSDWLPFFGKNALFYKEEYFGYNICHWHPFIDLHQCKTSSETGRPQSSLYWF